MKNKEAYFGSLLRQLYIEQEAGFLLEYKREITEKVLGAKLEQAGKADGERSLANVLDGLEQADPSATKQYVEWLCRQYIKQLFRLEDSSRVREVLERFEKIKNKLAQKDINKYTFHSLQDLMDEHFEKVVLTNVNAKDVKDAKVLYDGPLGQLTVPGSKKASCTLGAGTKWCTAASNNNMFAHYNRQGPLYIWKDKSGEKYQFHFETGQFMDDKDRPISSIEVEKFRNKNPVTKALFIKKEDELLAKLSDPDDNTAINGITSYGNKFITVPWPKLEDAILKTKHYGMAYAYANAMLKKPWPAGEELMAADPKTAYLYATNVLKKPWPEGEKKIMNDRHYGVLYTQKFPKSSYKDFAKKQDTK